MSLAGGAGAIASRLALRAPRVESSTLVETGRARGELTSIELLDVHLWCYLAWTSGRRSPRLESPQPRAGGRHPVYRRPLTSGEAERRHPCERCACRSYHLGVLGDRTCSTPPAAPTGPGRPIPRASRGHRGTPLRPVFQKSRPAPRPASPDTLHLLPKLLTLLNRSCRPSKHAGSHQTRDTPRPLPQQPSPIVGRYNHVPLVIAPVPSS
jgi:hypothetical protein